MKAKIVTVRLTELKTNLFVRSALNQDHALLLAELLENGTDLPPIKITCDNVVIDGRHRIEAADLNKLTEIRAEVVEAVDESDVIAMAYQANCGGSLPPTTQDTEHTVKLLLDRGETIKRIAELLALPPGMARKYINEVKSKVTRAKLARAADAITEGGLTVAKAAEEYDVDPNKLKEVLSGHRRKNRQGIAEVHRTLTKQQKSASSRTAALLKRVIEQYEDGDVTEHQVREIFMHLDQGHKRSARTLVDWKKRFEGANSAKPPKKKAA